MQWLISANGKGMQPPNNVTTGNGRGLFWSFHIVRVFDRVARWRCPPVPHLLR
jgi:hypothetical protein